MECTPTWGRPKTKFNTQDEAIIMCKIRNKEPKRIHKLVPYRCSVCHKFHIGNNGKLLEKQTNIYDEI